MDFLQDKQDIRGGDAVKRVKIIGLVFENIIPINE